MITRPHTIWYDEGRLAKKLGKNMSDCPYKEYSYGWAQWILGYKEEISHYID